jgi:hypothetical protein
VTVAAGVPRDAKPIVSGGILRRLVEFPRFLSLLVVIVLFLFITLLHVHEYENAFPDLRLVKSALYDTMLLSFRSPALVEMHHPQIDVLSLSTCVALNSVCSYSLSSCPGTPTKVQALSRRRSLSMQTCTSA